MSSVCIRVKLKFGLVCETALRHRLSKVFDWKRLKDLITSSDNSLKLVT